MRGLARRLTAGGVRPPAATPSRPGMGRTRAVLVAGAASAFAEHGLRGATMQAVATAAGVAKGTLYNYFRTKDEIARALVDLSPEAWSALTARLAAALGTDEEGAGLAARWLLGVVLQPGRSSARHRAAARLAAVLPVSAVAADG